MKLVTYTSFSVLTASLVVGAAVRNMETNDTLANAVWEHIKNSKANILVIYTKICVLPSKIDDFSFPVSAHLFTFFNVFKKMKDNGQSML